jgi:WD40 repeat protein
MRLQYRPVAVIALIAAATAGISATVSTPAAATSAPARSAPPSPATAGKSVWVARFNSAAGDAEATSQAVSPDGSRVYVTGLAPGGSKGDRDAAFVTIAYNAATGAQLWMATFTGDATNAPAVAVSPDGSTVFVTGSTTGGPVHGYSPVTLAYNAATGTQQWISQLALQAAGRTGGLVVSSDGSKVYLMEAAGQYPAPRTYVAIALDATTGAELWSAEKALPANNSFTPYAIALSPSGTQVFITGTGGTVAFDADNGAVQWAVRYPNKSKLTAYAVAVSPDSSTVFVTGVMPSAQVHAYWTVAYNAGTGAQRWLETYQGSGVSVATSVAVSPDGSAVFVSGTVETANLHQMHIVTFAYNPATGAQLWMARYLNETPAIHQLTAPALAVTPDSSTLVVTAARNVNGGPDQDVLLAYNTGTGATKSTAIYQDPGNGHSIPFALTLRPGGAMAFVTGVLLPTTSNFLEYQTVAFRF